MRVQAMIYEGFTLPIIWQHLSRSAKCMVMAAGPKSLYQAAKLQVTYWRTVMPEQGPFCKMVRPDTASLPSL